MAYFVWLLVGVIWGSTWLFIKIGLQDLPPFSFAALRFGLALIPLIALMKLRRLSLPKSNRDWVLMILTGLLTITMNYSLVFWGGNYISAGLIATLYTTLPLFTLIFAHFLIAKERMTWPKLTGVLIGMAGVAVIFSQQLQINDWLAIWGSTAIVLATVGTGLSSVIIKRQGRHFDPITLTTVQTAIGLIPLSILAIAIDGNPFDFAWTPTAIISLFYLAFIGSSLAFVLMFWLIKRMDVSKTQLTPLISTITAVALGIVILNETLTWQIMVGGVAIVLGLMLSFYKPKRVMTDSHAVPEKPITPE